MEAVVKSYDKLQRLFEGDHPSRRRYGSFGFGLKSFIMGSGAKETARRHDLSESQAQDTLTYRRLGSLDLGRFDSSAERTLTTRTVRGV